MCIEGMWGLGQMDIWGKGHFGAKGRCGTNEHWGKWALGANGHLRQMGTRKNLHQGKWAMGANGYWEQMARYLGLMGVEGM